MTIVAETKLGEFIRRWRQEHGEMSIRELAERAKLSHSYIANLERGFDYATGKPTKPSVEKLSQLAKGMGMDPDDLIRIARGESPKPTEPKPQDRGEYFQVVQGTRKRYDWTDDEEATIREMDAMGDWHSEFVDPGFWELPPEEREGSFAHVRGLIRERNRRLRMQGKG